MQPASDRPLRTDTPAGMRELADRARRLAKELTDEAEVNQFIGIAEEMEIQATALEGRSRAEH